MLEKSQSTKIFLPLLSLFSLDKWAELISDPSPSDQVFVLRFVSQLVSLSHIAVCFFRSQASLQSKRSRTGTFH